MVFFDDVAQGLVLEGCNSKMCPKMRCLYNFVTVCEAAHSLSVMPQVEAVLHTLLLAASCATGCI